MATRSASLTPQSPSELRGSLLRGLRRLSMLVLLDCWEHRGIILVKSPKKATCFCESLEKARAVCAKNSRAARLTMTALSEWLFPKPGHPKTESSAKPTIHTPSSASASFILLPVPTEAKWTQSSDLDDIEAWLAEKLVFPRAL